MDKLYQFYRKVTLATVNSSVMCCESLQITQFDHQYGTTFHSETFVLHSVLSLLNIDYQILQRESAAITV